MIAVEGWMHPVTGGLPDAGGKTLRSGRVRNDSRAVASFVLPFSGNAHAVMEAMRNWTVMFDCLDEICDEVKPSSRWRRRRSAIRA